MAIANGAEFADVSPGGLRPGQVQTARRAPLPAVDRCAHVARLFTPSAVLLPGLPCMSRSRSESMHHHGHPVEPRMRLLMQMRIDT